MIFKEIFSSFSPYKFILAISSRGLLTFLTVENLPLGAGLITAVFVPLP